MKSLRGIELEQFEVHQGKEKLMQLGLGLQLFLPRPFNTIAKEFNSFWQKYLKWVGKETFTWARLGGGNRSRSAGPAVFKTVDAWLTGQKDFGKACFVSIHDGPMDCMGRHGFDLEGYGGTPDDGAGLGWLSLSLPLEYLDDPGPAEVAARLVGLVKEVPFYSGTAGLFFNRSPYEFNSTIEHMAALSRRFQGVEISAAQRSCYWADKGITTVNWLTFVGDIFVEKLGGRAKLTNALPAECGVTSLDKGVVIQAGGHPVLGDVNRGKDELELWRKAYHVLKPAQFVDPIYEFDVDHFDGQRTAEWLRRLE